MRKVLAVLAGGAAALVSVLAAPPAHAECDAASVAVAGRVYVAVHDDGGVSTYLEYNSIPGLQRGGTNAIGAADPCGQSADPDLFVF